MQVLAGIGKAFDSNGRDASAYLVRDGIHLRRLFHRYARAQSRGDGRAAATGGSPCFQRGPAGRSGSSPSGHQGRNRGWPVARMPRLYDRERSGNAYKVRLLLSFLGVPYERIPVSLKEGRNQVDSHYLQLNPRGQIPTLQDGDVTLWGSTAILTYLALRSDKTEQWLPRDPARFGQAMQWLELAQNEI
jgi:hypothetical protein